jgi:SAM-dependent methyltransferase
VCQLKDYDHLHLDKSHRQILVDELEFWHRAYLPIRGTVLDIGAGNGETAFFYLKHGANHVICIEPEATLLYENFGNDPRVTIIPRAVNSIKSDCEGGERDMVVETHFASMLEYIPVPLSFPNKITVWRLKRIREPFGGLMERANVHMLRIQLMHALRIAIDEMFWWRHRR